MLPTETCILVFGCEGMQKPCAMIGEDGKLQYLGEVEDGKPHGRGTAILTSEEELVFVSGKFERGTLSYGYSWELDHDKRFYRGDLDPATLKPHGHGKVVVDKVHTVYEGEFCQGKRHGQGTSFYRDGSVEYTGRWEHDHKSGADGKLFQETGELLYHGDFREDLYHGSGTSYCHGRLAYKGEWKAGEYDGVGVLYDPEEGHVCFVGNFSQGWRHGQGMEFTADGLTSYSGEFEHGFKHGPGKQWVFDDEGTLQEVYEGSWEEGFREGHGSSKNAAKVILYDGGWKNGMRHGIGTEYNDSGFMVYEGDYRGGKRQGLGTHLFDMQMCQDINQVQFQKYHGSFHDNHFHGQGTLESITVDLNSFLNDNTSYRSQCTVYDGSWCKGLRHGSGKQTELGTLQVYEGSFELDKRHGFGTVFSAQGTILYQGEFYQDVKQGTGKLYEHVLLDDTLDPEDTRCNEHQHRLLYMGEFSKDRAHGHGVEYTYVEEESNLLQWQVRYTGEFRDGQRHGKGEEVDFEGRRLFDGLYECGRRSWGRGFRPESGDMHFEGYWSGEIPNVSRTETETLKRKRQGELEGAVCTLYQDTEVCIPTCVLCKEELHHGKPSFIYIPCGHRVLCGACGESSLGPWKSACPVCREEAVQLVRVFH